MGFTKQPTKRARAEKPEVGPDGEIVLAPGETLEGYVDGYVPPAAAQAPGSPARAPAGKQPKVPQTAAQLYKADQKKDEALVDWKDAGNVAREE